MEKASGGSFARANRKADEDEWDMTLNRSRHEQHRARARCEMSRRDGAIVAWHEVPGPAPSQTKRPVGYGLIRAGERTDSRDWMIGVTKFRSTKLRQFVLYLFLFSLP
jgi:hypothetical protein